MHLRLKALRETIGKLRDIAAGMNDEEIRAI